MMPFTTTYRQGDVVLVPFPFTDQTEQKQRPAVVVSSDRYNSIGQDLIMAAITSNVPAAPGFDQVMLLPQEWQRAGLLHPSVVLAGKLFTIHRDLIRRRFGRFRPETCANIISCIQGLINNN